MRIMVVDDEKIVRMSLRFLLESIGLECEVFEDGTFALDAFRDSPGRFDAIITDLAMPVMRGTELYERVRAIDPSIPVLILSGLLDDERVERFQRDGVIRMLAKPALLDEIVAALKSQGLDLDHETVAA